MMALAVTLSACGIPGATPTGSSPSPSVSGLKASSAVPTPNSSPPPESGVIATMLANMARNGYNPDPQLSGGLGGLYVNWRTGTAPLQANIGGNGLPDAPTVHRHDPLTELRYLHVLLVHRSLHPGDRRDAAEIGRYLPIVKRDFASAHDERGWVYDELIDIARLSGDADFRADAESEARYLDTRLFNSRVGGIFTTSTTYPTGLYRTDLAVDSAAALIQASVDFSTPQWRVDGARALDFVYAHAYIASAGTFMMVMQNVLQPDGTANPVETVVHARYRNELIDGGAVKTAEVALMALGLLHAAAATNDPQLADRAAAILSPLTPSQNSLGLWDPVNLGYFAWVSFPGPTAQQPGIPVVDRAFKEAGRQTLLLEAFHVADSFARLNQRFADAERLMTSVATTRAYYAPGDGVLFATRPDWTPRSPDQTWVTSEAMDITLESLLAVSRGTPW